MVSTHVHNNFVLIVEDDNKLNRLFCKSLRKAGFKPEGVNSIQEAINFLNHFTPPRVIVIDVNLKDGLGTELLDHRDELNLDHTRVIVISGNIMALDTVRHDYDVDYILEKPISPRILIGRVQELCG